MKSLKKLAYNVAGNLIAQLLITGLGLTALSSAYFHFTTGSWSTILNSRGWLFIPIAGILILLFRRKNRSVKRRNARFGYRPGPLSAPIGYFPYAGLLWRVRDKQPRRSSSPLRTIDPDSVYIEETPRCPECETELKEKEYISLHRLKCVEPKCNFTKWSLKSPSAIRENVKPIVQSRLEKDQYEDFRPLASGY